VLVATALIGATNVLAGAVQAHGRFGWSASEGVVFNLVMITVALAVGQRYGVTALAAAFVLGSAARLLVQLPAVRAAGMRLRPSLDLRDPGLREMAVLVPPLLVGSALANVSTLVDRAVGSAVGEGAITALSYGFRLVSLADTLFVAALATSLYPALARAAVPGREQEMAELVRRACGVLAILLAPVAVGVRVSPRA
jgi:putative peptidoglycan lipid II flippase